MYTILLNILIGPNIAATKSKPNIPTNPQFKAPTITNIKAIVLIILEFIFTSPFRVEVFVNMIIITPFLKFVYEN